MYTKYSLGFLLASIIQAAIVLLSEFFGLSNLGAKLTLMQLIVHILTGQVAGFILLYVMRKVDVIGEARTWMIGTTFGILFWFIVLSINSMQGKVNAPWTQGLFTMLISIIAFITYGLITTSTIKKYASNELKS